MNVGMKEERLDFEWIRLMKEAKEIGLTTEEIRLFIQGIKEAACVK